MGSEMCIRDSHCAAGTARVRARGFVLVLPPRQHNTACQLARGSVTQWGIARTRRGITSYPTNFYSAHYASCGGGTVFVRACARGGAKYRRCTGVSPNMVAQNSQETTESLKAAASLAQNLDRSQLKDKTRVYSLAKQLGLSSRELVAQLKDMGLKMALIHI